MKRVVSQVKMWKWYYIRHWYKRYTRDDLPPRPTHRCCHLKSLLTLHGILDTAGSGISSVCVVIHRDWTTFHPSRIYKVLSGVHLTFSIVAPSNRQDEDSRMCCAIRRGRYGGQWRSLPTQEGSWRVWYRGEVHGNQELWQTRATPLCAPSCSLLRRSLLHGWEPSPDPKPLPANQQALQRWPLLLWRQLQR